MAEEKGQHSDNIADQEYDRAFDETSDQIALAMQEEMKKKAKEKIAADNSISDGEKQAFAQAFLMLISFVVNQELGILTVLQRL